MKPTGESCAYVAVQSLPLNIQYQQMDCQAYMEWVVQQAGGKMAYAGSNAMARACHKAGTMMTLAEAKRAGKLIKGAFVFIHEDSGEPAHYKPDGLGNYNHVGMFVGENAVQDLDKSGTRRWCNIMHSSATMGRVAGSTLANGWTHVGFMPEIDYGKDTDVPTKPEEQKEDNAMYTIKCNTEQLRIRQAATTESQRIGILRRGDVVKAVRKEGVWFELADGGYVHGDYVIVVKQNDDAPAPTAGAVTREEFDALVARVAALETASRMEVGDDE